MGSEQSTQTGQKIPQSPPEGEEAQVLQSPTTSRLRDGGLSPRQESVCSDHDVPYVSYTVNKPIGDSPKKTAVKSASVAGRFASPRLSSRSSQRDRLSKSSHNTLVTVNKVKLADDIKFDTDLIRLQEIPTFCPIMQNNTSDGGVGKGPSQAEVLSRLDPGPLNCILHRYQEYLKMCAAGVASEQGNINRRVREIETEVTSLASNLQERQKQYEKNCEKLSSVREISRSLAKCHMLLNENIDMMDALNSTLPTDLRLEPFVWTTG